MVCMALPSADMIGPGPVPAPIGRPPARDGNRLIADDLTNRQITSKLHLSGRAVETHVTNMVNKLGLNSRTQLSRWIADVAAAPSVL